MKPRLRFSLPVLRPVTEHSFAIHHAALDGWLEQLPLGSLGEACRQIFLALYEVNRTQHALEQRLEFLERIARPLSQVLPVLRGRFIGQPVPLPEKTRQIANLAIDLQVEMVIGYRLVLEGLRRLPWFRRWGSGQRKIIAAHRVLHYLGGILSDYQGLRLPYPRGVWRTVHRIFRHEGHAGRIRRQLARMAGGDTTATVLDEYKRLLLQTLVPQARIQAGQWLHIEGCLQEWLPLVDFDPTSVEYGFWVRIDSDQPPTELPVDLLSAMGGKGKHTVLNTRRLVQHLERMLAGDDAGLPAGIQRSTLTLLCNVWSGARGRHGERRKGHGQSVRLVAGIAVLHQSLAGAAPRPAPAAALELDHPAPGQRKSVPPSLQLHASPAVVEALLTPIDAQVIDRSATGLGLELPPASAYPLVEGEIVGLRSADAHGWEIGYVCWLRTEEGKPIRLGVQHLAIEALPVEIVVAVHGQPSVSLGCLLGTLATGETALFVPHLPGIERKTLRLGYDGHDTAIVLHERFEGSAAFGAFLFDTPHEHDTAVTSGAQAQDAWRVRADASSAAEEEATRYHTVWSGL